MEIKYLTQLYNNPSITNKTTGYVKTLKGISLAEMATLEATYNGGNSFPAALRELLFLAGNYCYVLDYCMNDTQEKMQEDVRELLSDRNLQITRSFFAIDVYNASSQFLFVYLDEGVDDPIVYEVAFYLNEWIHSLNGTLSTFINNGLVRLLSGYSVF